MNRHGRTMLAAAALAAARRTLRLVLLGAVVASLAVLAAVKPATAAPGPGAQPAKGGPPADPGLAQKAAREGSVQVIVRVKAKADQDEVAKVTAGGHGRVAVKYHRFPLLALSVDSHALDALQRSPRVVSVREDVPEPPALASTIPLINGDDVHRLNWTGTGWAVAVLDTGIDRDHPFFGSRVVSEACYSNTRGRGVSLCPDGTATQIGGGAADAETAQCLNGTANLCDHGPHVAGIAAGSGAGVTGAPGNGVAPAADIIAIQVFTRFNNASDCTGGTAPCVRAAVADQLLGLQRVLDLDPTMNIAAVNVSIGNDANNTTACDGDDRKLVVDNLLNAGIPTVIAAGNEGHPNGVGAPGCISTAVTVGNSTDADAVAGDSNRGPLLDLFAPGSNIDSSVPDDIFGNMSGTSMAAPHVAGSFAVLRHAYPSATAAQLLGYLQTTGVPITYSTGGTSTATTPRIDLLAALQAGNDPPVLTASQAAVTVPEGSAATNTGTFGDPESDPVSLSASAGTVTTTGPGSWSWTYGTNDGPTQSQLVTVTGTDDKGETGNVTFALTVDNVPPTVTMDPAQATTLDEGDLLQVAAHFSDPGWADTYSGSLDWGTGETTPGSLSVTVQGPPEDKGDVTGSHQYGDDGAFTIRVSVTDDDGGTGSGSFLLQVANVAPTAAIDESAATLVNGVPTVIAHAGEPLSFTGRSTDPGSDDLTLAWDWADGGSSPDVSTTSLVNPPETDPDPSPSVQPRDVTDTQVHAFGDACLYQVGFQATDDDGGTASDTTQVIVAGNAEARRSAGYWQQQYRGNGPRDLTNAQLQCRLAVARHMSRVFDEVTDASTVDEAADVLFVNLNTGTIEQIFDRQLLAAWVNFANGAVDLDTLVDTDGDRVADTSFGTVIATAEAVRLDPSHTRAQLDAQKTTLQRINEPRA